MEGLVTSVTTCLTKPGYAWATTVDGLYRSTDGGATFVNLNSNGYPAGEKAYPAQVTVSPADPDTIFVATDYQTWAYALGKATKFAGDCSYYYSHDGGATWTAMSDCDRVCTAAKNGTVYGFKGYKIVKSADAGLTWEAICTISNGGLVDMAYCEADGSLWTVGTTGIVTRIVNGELSASLPFGNCDVLIGSVEAKSIACDPVSGAVYVAGIFRTETEKGGILRSTDCGKTWALITRTTENNVANEGPYGTSFLRVNPNTRELFTIGSCRGLWKTKPQ